MLTILGFVLFAATWGGIRALHGAGLFNPVDHEPTTQEKILRTFTGRMAAHIYGFIGSFFILWQLVGFYPEWAAYFAGIATLGFYLGALDGWGEIFLSFEKSGKQGFLNRKDKWLTKLTDWIVGYKGQAVTDAYVRRWGAWHACLRWAFFYPTFIALAFSGKIAAYACDRFFWCYATSDFYFWPLVIGLVCPLAGLMYAGIRYGVYSFRANEFFTYALLGGAYYVALMTVG